MADASQLSLGKDDLSLEGGEGRLSNAVWISGISPTQCELCDIKSRLSAVLRANQTADVAFLVNRLEPNLGRVTCGLTEGERCNEVKVREGLPFSGHRMSIVYWSADKDKKGSRCNRARCFLRSQLMALRRALKQLNA